MSDCAFVVFLAVLCLNVASCFFDWTMLWCFGSDRAPALRINGCVRLNVDKKVFY